MTDPKPAGTVPANHSHRPTPTEFEGTIWWHSSLSGLSCCSPSLR